MTNRHDDHDHEGILGGAASPNTPGASYADSNERDIAAKQSSPSRSAAFDDPDIDSSKVETLPGTGGPDDVGDTEIEPSDYNRSGH